VLSKNSTRENLFIEYSYSYSYSYRTTKIPFLNKVELNISSTLSAQLN